MTGRRFSDNGKGFAKGVEVGLVAEGGEIFEQDSEFVGDRGVEAAGGFDVVKKAAELFFVLVDGSHGMEQGVKTVDDGKMGGRV